jgi:hypothetical protein
VKLEKTEDSLNVSFKDSPLHGSYTTDINIYMSFSNERTKLQFVGNLSSITADLDKGGVEQLIYVLTLARNRMK